MASGPRNIYLHFLDRELRGSVGCTPTSIHVLNALLAGAALTPGVLFCGYSHLWESHDVVDPVRSTVVGLVSTGILVPASDYITSAEFLDSRQRIYAHDAIRYPFYFPSRGDIGIGLEPGFKTSGGATHSLQRQLSAVATAGDGASDAVRRLIETGLATRGERAITAALFANASPDKDALAKTRRLISEAYTRHYMSQCGADVLTGFQGLTAYDSLGAMFPLRDLRVFGRFLSLLGVLPRDTAAAGERIEQVVAQHASTERAMFLEAWRLLIESLEPVGPGLAREPRIGAIAADLQARATRVQWRKARTLKFDHLGDIATRLRMAGGTVVTSGDSAQLEIESGRATRGLIIVATDREWNAVKDYALGRGFTVTALAYPNIASWRIGEVCGRELILVRCEMGTLAAGGSMLAAEDAIRTFDPAFVVMPGIAFGLKHGDQCLEDLLVGSRVIDYETVKLMPDRIHERGASYEASVELVARARSIAAGNKRIHFGQMLCGCKLVNNEQAVKDLRNRFPDAIGGEMEGVGVAAACHRHNKPWLVAKAICDWGFNKGDDVQARAASVAVGFCFELCERAVF